MSLRTKQKKYGTQVETTISSFQDAADHDALTAYQESKRVLASAKNQHETASELLDRAEAAHADAKSKAKKVVV